MLEKLVSAVKMQYYCNFSNVHMCRNITAHTYAQYAQEILYNAAVIWSFPAEI